MNPQTPPARGASLIATLLFAAFAPVLPAQSSQTRSDDQDNPEAFSRVRGLFDVDLPKTVEKFAAEVILHPHFGDLLHRDYLRVPVGIRLGLNNRLEVSTEVESYLTHGLKKSGAGYGVGAVRLGGKYQWNDWLKPLVDTSTGVNFVAPVGRPPHDLTDGYYHASPYITFSRRWPDLPRLTPFVSLGTDLMWKSSVPGEFGKNQPHTDSMGVSAGYFFDYNSRFKYTLVTSYWTTSLIGSGNKQFFSVNPSILWQLPTSLTFHSRGSWILGVGLRGSFGPDGTKLGASTKLRGEFNFSRFFGGKHDDK